MTAGSYDERIQESTFLGLGSTQGLLCCDAFAVSNLDVVVLILATDFGMSATYEDLRASECTSCLATDDKSAYW